MFHAYMVFVFFYRTDAAKRQTAGIKYNHRQKFRFFAPQGRLNATNDLRQTWQDRPARWFAWLAVQNFTSIATGGGNAAPKYQKIPVFGKR